MEQESNRSIAEDKNELMGKLCKFIILAHEHEQVSIKGRKS